MDDSQVALDQLAADRTIEEVLLSGGDPLTLSDQRLAMLIERLDSIPHLRRLRIHTRLPIVIPQRVTDRLVTLLRATRLTTFVVVHSNHPAELDAAVGHAVGRFVDAGIPVLNQSVLLRGVNDAADTLVALSRRLIDLRVMPYYLHQLDRVAGAAHFHVPVERGEQIVAAMRSQLPGYAVPRYVREEPGQPSKTLLA
jgi:KamA family protein